MKINGTPHRSIWRGASDIVQIIDQRWLPFDLRIVPLITRTNFATAIRDMWVHGAPVIGATAAWGIAAEMVRDPSDAALASAHTELNATRPTAINLKWALDRMQAALMRLPTTQRADAAANLATAICKEDVEINRQIGLPGLPIIKDIAARKFRGNILTHCNAGWQVTVDWGTATSPIYHAHDAGIPVHVFVDEARPRNQGAQLTAWELDCHRVPFYVALPSPTINWRARDGLREIPIEECSLDEVTPAALVTCLLSERGLCPPTKAGLATMSPYRGAR